MIYLQQKMIYLKTIASKIKGFVRNISGVPSISLPNCVDEDSIINYTIEGQSLQYGKNIIMSPYYTKSSTKNGIEYTVNTDGSITLNGTATTDTIFTIRSVRLQTPMILNTNKKYTLSGCPEGGSSATYSLYIQDYSLSNTFYDNGSGVTFTPNTHRWGCEIRVRAGVVAENLTFYPQLEEGSEATEYVMSQITPDTPIEVESVGELTKNLFEIRTPDLKGQPAYNGYGVTGCTVYDYGYRITAYAGIGFWFNNLEVGETYTLSCKFLTSGTSGVNFVIGQNTGQSATSTTKKQAWNNALKEGQFVSLQFTADETNLLSFGLGNSTAIEIGEIQLEKSSARTDYEPYGKYKLPIVCSGKNLFDKDNFTQTISEATREKNGYDYTITGNKGVLNNSSSGTFLIKLPKNIVVKNKTISISVYITMLEYGDMNNQIRAWTEFNGSAKDYQQSQIFSLNERVRLSWVFTNVDYELSGFRFYINGNKILFEMDTLQIETNSTATDYEPYIEPKTTNIYLDEPLRKIGAYADYIDFENCKVVRNISETILKGTEDCYSSSIETTNERIIYNLSVFKAMGSSPSKPSLCSHANTTTDANVGWSGTKFVMQVSSTDVRFYRPFYCGVAEFIEKTPYGWKQYLAQLYSEGNPFKVYCVRSEMSEEIINMPKPPTIKGTTIYSIGTEIQPSNMSVTYYSTSKE